MKKLWDVLKFCFGVVLGVALGVCLGVFGGILVSTFSSSLLHLT